MCGDAGLYASDLCHACVAVDCFMHVYLGLSDVQMCMLNAEWVRSMHGRLLVYR